MFLERLIKKIKFLLDSRSAKGKAFGYYPIIKVGLLSGGGKTVLYDDFAEAYGDLLRNAEVHCEVSIAGSMAFTFMVDFCDKRRFTEDSIVIQHKVFMSILGMKFFNEDSERLTLKYSNLEADRLNIDPMKWYFISRMDGDHYFTNEELKKYNLDNWR